jgi:hypothetical protein
MKSDASFIIGKNILKAAKAEGLIIISTMPLSGNNS